MADSALADATATAATDAAAHGVSFAEALRVWAARRGALASAARPGRSR